METEIRKAIEACLEKAAKMATKLNQSNGAADKLFGVAMTAEELIIAGKPEEAKRFLSVHCMI